MSEKKSKHLYELNKVLGEENNRLLFPCIKDLATNGVPLERFSNEDSNPSRQDLTQFMACWFKYIGASAKECLNWMIEYCVDVLSSISSSSNSRIRHSTKSNIKYIYKSDRTFDCGCENNPFKAQCDRDCPVYKKMFRKHQKRMAKKEPVLYEIEREREEEVKAEEVKPLVLSDREKYRAQFGEAMEVALDAKKRGVPPSAIVKLLNNRGFRTRTGKNWSYSVLGNELRRLY